MAGINPSTSHNFFFSRNCYFGARCAQPLALRANFSHSKIALNFKFVTSVYLQPYIVKLHLNSELKAKRVQKNEFVGGF